MLCRVISSFVKVKKIISIANLAAKSDLGCDILIEKLNQVFSANSLILHRKIERK